MKQFRWQIGLLIIMGSASTAWSKEHTYCLQKSYSEYGGTITCIENLGLSFKLFSEICEPENNELVTFETSYVASCPPKPRGVCRGQKMQSGAELPFISYIYKNDIAFLKSSCLNNGYSWIDNP